MKFFLASITFFLGLTAHAQITHLPGNNCRQFDNNPRFCESRQNCEYNHRTGACREDRNGGDRIETEEFNCESQNYQYRECSVWGEVVWATIVRQYSDTDCILNSTFGRYGSTIWVDRGCRARFQVKVRR